MSKEKPRKKKVVVTTTSQKPTVKPTSARRNVASAAEATKEPLSFNKQNYILMGAGLGLILLGLLLMAGGDMPSPDVWDDSLIYSTRRTLLAPIVMLAGLSLEVYAIFKK